MRISDWSSGVCSSDLIGHFRNAGDEGGEGADDRQEACEGHGFAAVLVVEVVGLLQVVAADDFRVWVAAQTFACGARSAGRRVGNEGVSKCRARGPTYH